LEILKAHRICIISGLPGIGKTTLARMLLLYFFEKNFDVVKIESDISEARALGYHNKPRFYYYDDFLGQTAQADKLNKNEDQKLLDFMAGVRDSNESVFVLTTREYILNQAKL
jgi:broad-specificity NMP kinase